MHLVWRQPDPAEAELRQSDHKLTLKGWQQQKFNCEQAGIITSVWKRSAVSNILLNEREDRFNKVLLARERGTFSLTLKRDHDGRNKISHNTMTRYKCKSYW